MDIIEQSAGGRAEIRQTPWDERAFGFPTSEILKISYADIAQLPPLFAEIDAWNAARGVRYCVSRTNASENTTKAALQHAGFYFAEASLTLSKSKLNRCNFDEITRRRVALRPAREDDRAAVRQIAASDFRFGRFLEDPFLEDGLASHRHANWAEDLLNQGLMQIATVNDTIVGFHAERLHDDGKTVDLILTGATGRYAMLSVPLWVSALESLQKRGVTNAKTMISAANTGVVNLYRALDFHFDTTLFGFHKRY